MSDLDVIRHEDEASDGLSLTQRVALRRITAGACSWHVQSAHDLATTGVGVERVREYVADMARVCADCQRGKVA